MSGGAWLAVALLVLVAGAPSALPDRVTALTAAARLAPAGRRGGAAGRLPWPRIAVGAAVAAVAGVGLVAGPALAAALGLVFGVVALLCRDVVRARGETRRRAELLAAVRLLVAELDAGARPGDALDAAAYVAPVYAHGLHAAARAAAVGDDPGAVLVATADTRTLGVAWQVIERTGAAPGAVLTHLAHDLAAVAEQRRAVAVALSGPRSSAAVLTGLPVLGVALGAVMGARPLPFLFDAGPGRAVCAVGVVLDAVGVLWMRRIVRRAQAVP